MYWYLIVIMLYGMSQSHANKCLNANICQCDGEISICRTQWQHWTAVILTSRWFYAVSSSIVNVRSIMPFPTVPRVFNIEYYFGTQLKQRIR